MTPGTKSTIIIASVGLFALILGVIIACLPHQYGTDQGADPITHQCEQSEATTCGPAACVSALSWVGIDTTEREMVLRCKTGPAGTYFPDLAAALHAPIQPMPLLAPGRTFVVYLDGMPAHCVCAHDDPVHGWLVNDPWQKTGPERWALADFSNASGCVEVKP